MLEPIPPGQKVRSLPRQDWNAHSEAARAYRDNRFNELIPGGMALGGAAIVEVTQNLIDVMPPLSILGLGVPTPSPDGAIEIFRNQLLFRGVTPTAAHWDKFVVLLEECPRQATARAAIHGCAWVKVDVQHEDDGYAHVKASDYTCLKSQATGVVKILWKQAGTGVKWAAVQIGVAAPVVVGTSDALISEGSSGLVSRAGSSANDTVTSYTANVPSAKSVVYGLDVNGILCVLEYKCST